LVIKPVWEKASKFVTVNPLYGDGTVPNPLLITGTSPKSNTIHPSVELLDVKELNSWLDWLLDVERSSVEESLEVLLEVVNASVELELELTLESELELELVVLLKNVDELDSVLESEESELVSETSVELEENSKVLCEEELDEDDITKLEKLELVSELVLSEELVLELEVVPRSVLLLDKEVEELSLVLISVLELEVVRSSVEEDDKLDENDSHNVSRSALSSSIVFGSFVTRILSPCCTSVSGRK